MTFSDIVIISCTLDVCWFYTSSYLVYLYSSASATRDDFAVQSESLDESRTLALAFKAEYNVLIHNPHPR